MDQHSTQPLTVEEAKARLCTAAQYASPTGWVRRHPWNALALALAGGFMTGRLRIPIAADLMLQQWVGPTLLKALVRRMGR